jgi:hypothetical protein
MKTIVMLCAAMLLIGAGTVGAKERGHEDMAGNISAAKTAKDHEALAAHYEAEAKEARTEAERHDKMGASYTGAAREKLHLEDHCKAIADNYRETAKALEALAAGERELAKGK